jgi:ATP-dependent RNA helicase RhlE
MLFSSLGIIEPILKALEEEGYTTPTPIQAQSIPIILRGTDLLGCAQTGTGKTAAFAIPILQLLGVNNGYAQKRKIRSLIVTPTRELALQIGESFGSYGRHTGLKYSVIFGGVSQHSQVSALKNGVDIVVATPGRLLDLMNQWFVSLSDVEIFTLDEADRMLDMGFVRDVKKILSVLPKKRQSLFFSATMPWDIVKLASTILHNPQKVTVTPVSSTAEIIKQHVYFVDKGNKHALLLDILKDSAIKTALVFTRTKHAANKVVEILIKNNVSAEAIHGNKAQNARQRALTNFKAQTTRILVATDIAARGIDVDELEYVINYEMSNVAETYVHRIGRTGRAGAKGTAYSFCDAEEKEYLRDVEKLIAKKIPVIEDHPFPLRDHNPIKAPKQPQGRRGAPRSGPTGSKPAGSKNQEKSSQRQPEKKWFQSMPPSRSSENKGPRMDREPSKNGEMQDGWTARTNSRPAGKKFAGPRNDSAMSPGAKNAWEFRTERREPESREQRPFRSSSGSPQKRFSNDRYATWEGESSRSSQKPQSERGEGRSPSSSAPKSSSGAYKWKDSRPARTSKPRPPKRSQSQSGPRPGSAPSRTSQPKRAFGKPKTGR